MNEELLYGMWKVYKERLVTFRDKTAKATAYKVIGSMTRDGIRVGSRKINWAELAIAWNNE